MMYRNDVLKEVCRFTIATATEDRINKFTDFGATLVVNPRVPTNKAKYMLIDLIEKKFTFLSSEFEGSSLMNIALLNDFYAGESLETLVTIPIT